MDKADISWLLVSTLLVLMMAVPGLAMFYGGLVRSKNVLSVLLQVLCTFVLGLVLWFIYGYSLAFTEGNAFFGGLSRAFFSGMFTPADGKYAMSNTLTELLFASFQATFAGITCALIVGSFAERARFSAVLVFTVIWFTFAYIPIAHMVWFASETAPGLLNAKGALDFAGGTVVHINAGVAGLVGAYVVGKRVGYGREAMQPHNLPMTFVGAALLWVGWFGFNAGSALAANENATLAFFKHHDRHRRRCTGLVVHRMGCEGQAVDAGRCVRRDCRPGGYHPGSRPGRPGGRTGHRRHRRRRLRLGCEWSEASAACR
ncbi:ammonium transporter [Achromobacter piechaudii ATCC 43553]|uniref:Ammonium transporter n=1 Tax=Achromobacter piechaudii ATCC 43553 TaxID=742159 RepID=D4XAZ9_9BURK|nr:ammonium transporter [Achromobacter piechaudii ATCC 43553]